MKTIISTSSAPAAIGPYSQAVVCGNLIFTSGQIGLDPESGNLIEGIEAQARRVMENLKAVLAEAGCTFADVVKFTVFIADLKDFALVNSIMAEEVPEPFPARSCVQIAALPKGAGSEYVRRLMDACAKLLKDSQTNARRVAQGNLPATDCWLWGQGKRPTMKTFAQAYDWGPGAMITAVDLLRGIANNLGWRVLDVPGATGYVDTNFAGKGEYAARALDENDIVVVHVEAPDESGHEGSVEKKIHSLEEIDQKTLPPILDKLQSYDNWRLLVSPDHPTPISKKTHSRGEVPWMIVGSDVSGDGFATYDESTGARSSRYYPQGQDLMTLFLRGDLS